VNRARAAVVLGCLGVLTTAILAALPGRHVWPLAFVSITTGCVAVVMGLVYLRRHRRNRETP
jgi:hypothetical protein